MQLDTEGSNGHASLHSRTVALGVFDPGSISINTKQVRNRIENGKVCRQELSVEKRGFYHSAITQPVVCACIMVEMGSHLPKGFLFNHTTPFSTKGLEKSLCDFTGTIFVQCEKPKVIHSVSSVQKKTPPQTQS